MSVSRRAQRWKIANISKQMLETPKEPAAYFTSRDNIKNNPCPILQFYSFTLPPTPDRIKKEQHKLEGRTVTRDADDREGFHNCNIIDIRIALNLFSIHIVDSCSQFLMWRRFQPVADARGGSGGGWGKFWIIAIICTLSGLKLKCVVVYFCQQL